MKTKKERYTVGTTINVFELGELRRLAEENKVEVTINWERGFEIERIEWLNGYDPDQQNAVVSNPTKCHPHTPDGISSRVAL